MWFPAMFYVWKILGFFKLWEDGSSWESKCGVVMRCDGQDEDLADYVYWNPVAIKWPFPGQVGFGLNASSRQIPLTNWRIRALWACHSDITGSIGCHVELQLVVNFRQSCEDLRSHGFNSWLVSSIGLAKPFHWCCTSLQYCVPCFFYFLCVTRPVSVTAVWSFQVCC